MFEIAKKFTKALFSSAGLAVCRPETLRKATRWDTEHRRHLILLAEVDRMLRSSVFSNVPDNARRLELMTELVSTSPPKAFNIVHYLHRALEVPGDVCEFGVAEGATSALIANELLEGDRDFWLFDSFEGLSKPTEKDVLLDDMFDLGSMEKYEGKLAFPQEVVNRRLERVEFPKQRLHVVPGFIEKTIKEAKFPKQVCFAYVDFDLYEPILTALKALDSKMPKGGFIVVDDYGCFSAGAATAVDEFVTSRPQVFRTIKPQVFSSEYIILEKFA